MRLVVLTIFVIFAWTVLSHATTTTTTLTPFHKSFLELCKVDANKLAEPYKTQVHNAQTAAHCEGK